MQVPAFMARQFYVVGSLRNTPTGFSLEAHNPLGDGTLVGVGRVAIDGVEVPAEAISAAPSSGEPAINAASVSKTNPIRVRRGDRVTLHIAAPALAPGRHRLEVELHEINLGALRFSLTDDLSEEPAPAG
jgi:hypothetical protein